MEQQTHVLQMLACGLGKVEKQMAKKFKINAELLWIWFNVEPPITEAILGEELEKVPPSFISIYDLPYSWESINDFALRLLAEVEFQLKRRKLQMGITLHEPEEDTDDEGLVDIDELVVDDDGCLL